VWVTEPVYNRASMSDTTPALRPGELSELIRASGEAILREVLAMTEAASAHHPAPREWCARQVVGHLIEAERRGFAGRIRQILAADRPALQGWDPDEVAASRNDCARRLPDLAREFQTMRHEGVALVFRLRGDDLTRGGDHPKVGFLTVGDIVNEWVHHDRAHLIQIAQCTQSFVLPHLGVAQGFLGE